MKIPKPKKLTKDEQIKILREEIKRKDDIITNLKKEKEILFNLSIKNENKIKELKKFR